MKPDQYCQERAAPRGSSAYYALLFVPARERAGVGALLAFRREVEAVLEECSDPTVARAKLEWWRGEVEAALAGQPQHPVTRALAPAVGRHEVAQEQLLEVVDGFEMDLEQAEYASYKALSLHCHLVGGILWTMIAQVLGYEDRQTLRYAQSLGMGLELASLIGRVRADARRGHVRLPADEMADFGVTRQGLYAPETSVGLRALLTVQARRSREHIQRAEDLLPAVDRYRQRAGLVFGAVCRATLDEMERDGFRVLERQVALTPLRKLWIALATAWREHRRERERQARGGSGPETPT
jgi:phytoene synthase